jgi:hypothetical protein
MAVQVKSDIGAWREMQSKLMATGWIPGGVTIGEPKAEPTQITAGIMAHRVFIDETTFQHPREVHQCILRIYGAFAEEPDEQIELELEQIRANIWSDINGDFDLGGATGSPNCAYIMPTLCSAQFTNLDVGRTMFRVLDMIIAYRIDDKAQFTA